MKSEGEKNFFLIIKINIFLSLYRNFLIFTKITKNALSRILEELDELIRWIVE